MARYADQSAVLQYGEKIDSRCLTLAGEFFELDREQAQGLLVTFAELLLDFMGGDYVMQWHVNGRRSTIRSLTEKLSVWSHAGTSIRVSANGFLKSYLVYDQRSRQRIEHYFSIPGMPGIRENPTLEIPPEYSGEMFVKAVRCTDWLQMDIKGMKSHILWNGDVNKIGFHSADYLQFWKELFGEEPCSRDELCRRVFRIFSEKGRWFQNIWSGPDILISFDAEPYKNIAELHRGSFQISINSCCVGSHKKEVADRFLIFAETLSDQYRNLNARVMLQPLAAYCGESPYMTYFGQNRLGDGSYEGTGQLPEEWYISWYLCGVEWGNLLSPRVMMHLPALEKNAAMTTGIWLKKLNNGAYLLRSSGGPEEFDVEEALELKKLVADALYPGGVAYSIAKILPSAGRFPQLLRKDWAVVPVFESEIEVIAKDLVLRACSRK